MSLDHQVRHSGRSRNCIVQFLGQLIVNITEASAIIKGERVPLDELEFSDSDASDISLSNAYDDSTELEQIVEDIAEIVTSLFDLTRSLSSADARELMINASNIDMQHFRFSDRLDVQLEFPRASSEIIERLVEANNKRRQIFKYLEGHRAATPGTVHVDSYSSTTQPEVPQSTARVLSSDSIEESGEVTTDEHLQLPVIPSQVLGGVPFTCPYCHEALHVSNVESWRLHVMEDLRPYVCTYEQCEYPLELFANQHPWMEHEKSHRREWMCNQCHNAFSSDAGLREHLLFEHGEVADDTIVDLCERSASLNDSIKCPMCAEFTLDFRKHVSKHLWVVALNTLPESEDSTLSSVGTDFRALHIDLISNNVWETAESELNPADFEPLNTRDRARLAKLSSFEETIPGFYTQDSRSTTLNLDMPEPEHKLTEVTKSNPKESGTPQSDKVKLESAQKLTKVTRHYCDMDACKERRKSFSRLADLARHQDTVHGPRPVRYLCSVKICNYHCLRRDKMKEHCQKMHDQSRGEEQFSSELYDAISEENPQWRWWHHNETAPQPVAKPAMQPVTPHDSPDLMDTEVDVTSYLKKKALSSKEGHQSKWLRNDYEQDW